jgi:hypothetical protein
MVYQKPRGYSKVRQSLKRFLSPNLPISFLPIIALTGALVLCLCPSRPVQAKSDLPPPKYDGQLYVDYSGGTGEKPATPLDPRSAEQIPFFGQAIDFYYGVKRERVGDRQPGVLVVKVIRLFDAKTEEIRFWTQKTRLYRTQFPAGLEIKDAGEYKELYKLYHESKVGDPFLRHSFHTGFPINQRTDGSDQRKASFLFNDSDKWNPPVSLQRTYLIYYSGVDSVGSWIRFDVKAAVETSEMLISIVDLGQPGTGDLVGTNWHIIRAKK